MNVCANCVMQKHCWQPPAGMVPGAWVGWPLCMLAMKLLLTVLTEQCMLE